MFSLSLSPTSPSRILSNPPVIAISTGSGYAGSVYAATSSSVGAGQWLADGAAIAGATSITWTMTLAHEGKAIRYVDASGTSQVIEMWVPQDVAGLVALMDARQGISLSGSAVTAWASQVGGISATQSTPSLQPSYSATAFAGTAPGVIFNGSNALFDLAINAAPTERTWIGAISFASSTASRTFISAQPTGGYSLRRNMDGTISIVSYAVGIRATSSAAVVEAQPVVLSASFDTGGAARFRIGGVSAGVLSMSGAFSGSGMTRIGSDVSGTSRMHGVISNHLIYDGALANADLLNAEGWVSRGLGLPG